MDRTTKGLLLAIAIGVWAHLVSEWITIPPRGLVQSDAFAIGVGSRIGRIETQLENIESELNGIANGVCVNPKIC